MGRNFECELYRCIISDDCVVNLAKKVETTFLQV